MKLLNHTLKYFIILVPILVGVWAALFYHNLINEVEDSIDDGLDNYKMLIINEATRDASILNNQEFNERNYVIKKLDRARALEMTETYADTLIYTINEQDLEPFRLLKTAFKLGDDYYELSVISSTVEKDDLKEDILFSIIWLYAFLLLSLFVINNLMLRKIWEPFYEVLNKIKNFNLDKNPVLKSTDTNVQEFKDLDQAVGALTKHVVLTYNSQKQFLENASHEMQTPLAISINKLELLIEQETLSDEQAALIDQVNQQLKRLTRLNKALILLTKIENKQFLVEKNVEVNSLVKEVLTQFDDFANSKNLQIEYKETAEISLGIHPDLLHILISNLIKNAIVHNQEGGQIRVSITENKIIISNTSTQSKLDIQAIFNRFEKFSTDPNRLGLGLAIAKAICEASDLKLNYKYEDQFHSFIISKK
jgi:signal transduction histidine kinase